MAMKKIQSQINAIMDTIDATKKRINDLQCELDALRNSPKTSKVTIEKKQSELYNLKFKLSAVLQFALLELETAPSAARSVVAAIRRL